MRWISSPALFALIGAAWAAVVGVGVSQVLSYESTPGVSARPPLVLSGGAAARHAGHGPTLVLLVHPRCPCSRATLGELAKLMTDCRGKLTATVLMLRPAGAPVDWERTDLWRTAAGIPGVTVDVDLTGGRARGFGAATSGQALLYAADGRLLFAGGITESRGHSGDNAGRAAITGIVLGAGAGIAHTPVYGCPLFDTAGVRNETGATSCPQ